VQVADLLQNRGGEAKRAAHLPEPPRWLVNWERRRPTLLIECIAEAVGVFFYVCTFSRDQLYSLQPERNSPSTNLTQTPDSEHPRLSSSLLP
jgi:hypothetical protein